MLLLRFLIINSLFSVHCRTKAFLNSCERDIGMLAMLATYGFVICVGQEFRQEFIICFRAGDSLPTLRERYHGMDKVCPKYPRVDRA